MAEANSAQLSEDFEDYAVRANATKHGLRLESAQL